MVTCTALIPARAGSKRVPGKNARFLNGKPLISYTIEPALASGLFSRVIVSTEDPAIATLAREYGAEVPFLRPAEFAQDASPDIEWLLDCLQRLQAENALPDAVAILRPTSPFRTVEMLKRAWKQFCDLGQSIDSLRAVEPSRYHPAKQWQIQANGLMEPVMPNPDPNTTPWHSMPLQQLPSVYVQNASLEIVWSSVVLKTHTLAGKKIAPFITQGNEGFDINTQEDWWLAERHLQQGNRKKP